MGDATGSKALLTMPFIPIGSQEPVIAVLTSLTREGKYIVAIFTPDWHYLNKVAKRRWIDKIRQYINQSGLLADWESLSSHDPGMELESNGLHFVIISGKEP